MRDKFPEIFKSKVDKLRSNVQKEFYYHHDDIDSNRKVKSNAANSLEKIDKTTLMKKINSIFSSPNYVYQADITIMYKNGENINKKVVGIKDNYLITFDGEKIYIDDIYDIK